MNASELVYECFRRTGIHRSDLNALAEFVEARDSGQLDAMKAIQLFWETWKPRVMVTVGADPVGYTSEEPPALDEDLESAFLEALAELELEYRIYYEPDSESAIDFEAASRYVHLGAASAMRHLRRDGYSDDVTQALLNVQMVLLLLQIEGTKYRLGESAWNHAIQSGIDEDTFHFARAIGLVKIDDAGGEVLTLWGVRCLVLGAASKQKYAEDHYEDSFKTAVDAFRSSEDIDYAVRRDEEYLLEKGIVTDELLKADREIRDAVRRCSPLLNLELQEIVDSFERLRWQGNIDSWRWVAAACDNLIWADPDYVEGEIVDDSDGKWHFWHGYWNFAKGWATAQLSPNDLRDFMRQQEWEASERRLRSYFFGDVWEKLPEKARENLVNVDNLWFTVARGTNAGSVLNDLQVATETTCYRYIWQPLQSIQGGQALLEFKKRDAELSNDGKSPTLSDYVWVCQGQFFRDFLKGAELSGEDQRFLQKWLPRALKDLYRSRNQSQHDPSVRVTRQEVEPFVKTFLGIGQEGVLRRLAEIGPMLARR